MSHRATRRQFLANGLVAAGTAYFVNPVQAQTTNSPNERLNLAAIGATGRAGRNITEVSSQNIVAIADVDATLLDKGSVRYPVARKYNDFRVMLEKEADKIDAVVIGTPDHTHAAATAMAMRLKKHVYCEKPLTHTVYEARKLAELAREFKLTTQMGTQIHAGDNYRRVVELVQSNAIGPVREVHVWVGVDYSGKKFTTGKPTPAHLDWDLWLGPAADRPYSEGVHPFNWRWFWDYGNGGLGDFGCHYIDLVHWALKLKGPTEISATGPEPNVESTTSGLTVNWKYPARGDLPPVSLTWYDGGKRPALLKELKDKAGRPIDWKSGQLFVGESGMILSNYGLHMLLPEEKFADFKSPDPFIPASIGHHNEWLKAIRDGGETTCNFEYSGALTEAVLLGVASYRSGQAIQWDAKNFKVVNAPDAQQHLHREYRKGWAL